MRLSVSCTQSVLAFDAKLSGAKKIIGLAANFISESDRKTAPN
jgi:hypothetical protein